MKGQRTQIEATQGDTTLQCKQRERERERERGLVVSWLLALGDLVLSQRGTSEHTVKQACLSSCCIARGGPSSKVFSDRFPERMVLEVKPG